MRAYPLAALQELRKRRTEEANQKLAAARAFEEGKKKEVEKAQKALNDYLTWIKQEADRLFRSVMGTLNPIHKITEVTQQVQWNRSQQSTYVVTLEEAKKRLKEAQQETERCVNAQQKAYKEEWKIAQHRQFWTKEEEQREEQEEEADLEEIANTIFLMKHG